MCVRAQADRELKQQHSNNNNNKHHNHCKHFCVNAYIYTKKIEHTQIKQNQTDLYEFYYYRYVSSFDVRSSQGR